MRRLLPLVLALALAAVPAFADPPAARHKVQGDDVPLTSAEVAELTETLDRVMTGSGDYAAAEELATRMEAQVLTTFGPRSREAVEVARILVMAAVVQGRVDEGVARGRQMVETGLQVIPGDDPLIYRAVAAYAVALRSAGQGGEALALVSEAVIEADQRLPPESLAGDELRMVQATLATEQDDPAAANAAFARLDERLGRRDDPTALALRAIALVSWGEFLSRQGATEAAIDTFRAAIAALDRQFAGSTRPRMVPVRLNAVSRLAALLAQTGQGAEVETLVRPLMAEVEAVYGPDAPIWSDLAFPLAMVLAGSGPGAPGAPGAAEALGLMRRVVANWSAIYGPDTLDMLRARMSLAVLLASTGDMAGAMAEIDRMERHALPEMQSQLTYVLHEGEVAGRITTEQAVESVLRLMQDTQSAGAAAAQRLLADRLSAGSDAGAAALRQRSDAEARLRADQASLGVAAALPLDQRDPEMVAALRAAIRTERDVVAEAEARLARDFPRLAAMTGAVPLDLAQIRARLGADEALVVLAPPTGPLDAGLVIAVSRDAVDWHTFQADAGQVEQAVARIRAGIEMRLGLRGAAALDGDAPAGPVAAFDHEAAHWLYAQTLGQVDGVIGAKRHLWVELRGVLSAVPPQLLETAPAPDADPAHAAWAARRFSFTILPAISGLPPPGAGARLPPGAGFLAFANPDLSALGAGAGASVQVALRGSLAPLPETAEEVRSVARALGADAAGLHLGADASEAAVKAAPLAQAGLIYFATHGLVSGDAVGAAALSEPALALTPGGGEDGFLTASEIAELPLNARFVVLSACNTAAGDLPGAEALSGLAQSFLYAGARALLVSHWPVESRSAAHLMTEIFRLRAQNPAMSSAEAQREAMIAMIDTPGSPWSHPAFWAPFVLVGDPD